MEITIDLQSFLDATSSPATFIWWLFLHGGWIFLIIGFFYIAGYGWLLYVRNKFDAKREYTMLAIDIPKNNEQSPKAMEQLFDHLAGIQTNPRWEDKWIKGKLQDSFSLEIVSIDGYIQFLIQTPTEYRDLAEAAVYAQYPDAEIIEVEDYTEKFKNLRFPNDKYQLWGAELKLANSEYYPIKTYPEFEHSLSQELKDPMAALLEILSRLKSGEQAWLQVVITPASRDWIQGGKNLVKKLMGASVKKKKSFLGQFDYVTKEILDLTVIKPVEQILGTPKAQKQEAKDAPPSLMLYLSPGERFAVESVENKISKIGFYTRIRYIYLARKEAFFPATRVDGVMGALAQFASGNNGFGLHKLKKTKVYGPLKEHRLNWRRNKILRMYKSRARKYRPGEYGYVLNTEELASLYHFPVMSVKAPLLKKTETKRTEPPISLPIERKPLNISSDEDLD